MQWRARNHGLNGRRTLRCCLALVVATAGALPLLALAGPAGANEGMQLVCDRADYGCVEGTGYRGQGLWGANYGKTGHNCTSYVSYRLSQLGVAQPWRPMGNANQWDDNARGKAVVDDIPAVGAVAQWEGGTRLAPGARGHVAYVEEVTASGIEVTDDTNAGRTRRIRISRGSPYWPDDFVHIHDVVPPSAPFSGVWALTNAKRPPLADPVDLAFGTAGDIPVVGDWDGDGDDTIGLFRDGTWTLTGSHEGEALPTRTARFGRAGDLPVVGDWDGDGDDTLGLFRDGTWLLSNSLASNPLVPRIFILGGPGDLPVVGDWDGVDGDTVGVFRDGLWTLSDSTNPSKAQPIQLRFGTTGDRPVRGDWDGVRGDSIGVFRDGTWLLPTANDALDQELSLLVLGTKGTTPLVGNWDGVGSDTIGVAR